MPVQVASPSGVAGPRGTSWDVPDNVRRVPAKWVRPQGPRLAMLVSWPGVAILSTHGETEAGLVSV
jgi:hypothetical protein